MTRPGIEPQSPRPLANTLLITPIQLIAGENKGVNTFPRSISPKVNVIAWLEFELTTMLQSNMLTTMPWGLFFNYEFNTL